MSSPETSSPIPSPTLVLTRHGKVGKYEKFGTFDMYIINHSDIAFQSVWLATGFPDGEEDSEIGPIAANSTHHIWTITREEINSPYIFDFYEEKGGKPYTYMAEIREEDSFRRNRQYITYLNQEGWILNLKHIIKKESSESQCVPFDHAEFRQECIDRFRAMSDAELLGSLAAEGYDRGFASAKMIYIGRLFGEIQARGWDMTAIKTESSYAMKPCILRNNVMIPITLDIPRDRAPLHLIGMKELEQPGAIDSFIGNIFAGEDIKKEVKRITMECQERECRENKK